MKKTVSEFWAIRRENHSILELSTTVYLNDVWIVWLLACFLKNGNRKVLFSLLVLGGMGTGVTFLVFELLCGFCALIFLEV